MNDVRQGNRAQQVSAPGPQGPRATGVSPASQQREAPGQDFSHGDQCDDWRCPVCAIDGRPFAWDPA